jgi:hypothetical protein
MDETPVTDEQPARRKFPTWAQGLVIAIAGAVLGVGGCLAFLNDMNSGLGQVGAILFVAGLIAVPIGGIWFLVGVIKAIASARGKPIE